MQLEQLKHPIHAELIGENLSFNSIAIDSRNIKPDQLFVAIIGENFDGHIFIEHAINQGAVAILASKPEFIQNLDVPVLLVEDTTIALGDIAKYHRDQFSLPVIGVTGSCGKTTVKAMLGSIFAQIGNPLVTEGNFNNQIGLPLTILKLSKEHTAAIIEMGASKSGDIEYLCNIANPSITLINNVQAAHLEGFGSLEGTAKAKGEIYQGLTKDDTAIVNLDDYFAKFWLDKLDKPNVITFGLSEKSQVRADNINISNTGISFDLFVPKSSVPHPVKLQVSGKHNVMNALAATSAALAANISISTIVEGLQNFNGVDGRLQKIKFYNGANIINDTYNANPGSVMAAIEVLVNAKSTQRILVLGDMLELGDKAIDHHKEIGKKAKEKGIDRLLTYGNLSQYAARGFGKNSLSFNNKQELVQELRPLLSSDSTCLVKGSRSTKMETIIQDLEKIEG